MTTGKHSSPFDQPRGLGAPPTAWTMWSRHMEDTRWVTGALSLRLRVSMRSCQLVLSPA